MKSEESSFIALAISLAKQCRDEDGRVHPRVGAVFVSSGKVVASGFRGMNGLGRHAEFAALETIPGLDIAGCTVYTTMEPCTIRRPPKRPCVDLLTERRVSRVIIGMLDPNPAITGRGLLRLREAGVDVSLFPQEFMFEVEDLNTAFAATHNFAFARPPRKLVTRGELIYTDLTGPDVSAFEKKIALVSVQSWDSLLKELARDPTALRTLPSRKFEELVAELMKRDGFEVQLTPETRDHGRDVMAFQTTSVGRILYLVECKRYAEDRPVDVAIVRTLYGVVEHDNANCGVLVTTSRFTKDALDFQKPIEYRLQLKDYQGVVRWVRSHAGNPKSGKV